MEEKKLILDDELNADGGKTLNDIGRLSPYGGNGMGFAAAEPAAVSAYTGDQMILADSELNAGGGTEKVLPSVMGLDEFAMVNNANEPEFMYAPAPVLVGELDKISGGMVAGLEEISGGELYIDGHRAEEANRPGRVVDSSTSITAEASDVSSWLL